MRPLLARIGRLGAAGTLEVECDVEAAGVAPTSDDGTPLVEASAEEVDAGPDETPVADVAEGFPATCSGGSVAGTSEAIGVKVISGVVVASSSARSGDVDPNVADEPSSGFSLTNGRVRVDSVLRAAGRAASVLASEGASVVAFGTFGLGPSAVGTLSESIAPTA